MTPNPKGYWSSSLSKAEQNYTTTEKEFLAVVWEVLNVRPYLEGSRFTIRPDHDALRWLMSLCDASGRLKRWRFRLQEFDLEFNNRPGAQQKAADATSRLRTAGLDQKDIFDDIPVIALAQALTNDSEEGKEGEEPWTTRQAFDF